MTDAEKVSPLVKASDGPPESPTTARPLDFDDDVHDTSAHNVPVTETPTVAKAVTTEATPPPKPPRPLSPREQAELTLREAFPTIDAAVIKAVLTASSGQVEPAFNALLGMSDPDSQREPSPPAKPPRPTQQIPAATTTAQSQLEADEMFARQLHEHYSGAARQQGQQRQSSLGWNQNPPRQPPRPKGQKPPEEERSFLDGWSDNAVNRKIIDALPTDDLPVIRENIRKGFLETQSTVNKWVNNLRKKIDGEPEDDLTGRPPQSADGYQATPPGRRSGDFSRRSADRERYDADPQVIGDDFSKLELRDADNVPPKRPNRPLANPDLFKPTPPAPVGRKVSFQDGPPEEISDLYSASPPLAPRPNPTNKSSKWQPLSTVDPSPVAENDPFSLGDSDDEKDAKSKDGKSEDFTKLPKPAFEDVEGVGSGKTGVPKP